VALIPHGSFLDRSGKAPGHSAKQPTAERFDQWLSGTSFCLAQGQFIHNRNRGQTPAKAGCQEVLDQRPVTGSKDLLNIRPRDPAVGKRGTEYAAGIAQIPRQAQHTSPMEDFGHA
jgi:hypothetical protein